jgi:N-acetylglucosaminyldiphosphoundecaprenol N-acetyl-beta-D-mannosaminyltransferase
LAALGAPKQEKFIYNYRNKLKVKIAMGVGGSLDVLAGRVKRAPEFYQKAGLEWLYRLAKEPGRIVRVIRIPKFIALALYDSRFK